MHEYGAISEPREDMGALTRALQDVKRILELMLGRTRDGNSKIVRHFVQRDTPTDVAERDLWTRPALLTGEKNILSYYYNGKWVKLVEGP